MSMETAPEARPSARADLAWSAFWLALGGLIVVESWRMDRLERLNINPYTVPGLVPGLLGIAILVLGAVLAARTLARRDAVAGVLEAMPWGRFALAVTLFAVYALGLVSRLPYWLATFVFVAGFIALFRRRIVFALVVGACTSAAVTVLFQSVFLVRLP